MRRRCRRVISQRHFGTVSTSQRLVPLQRFPNCTQILTTRMRMRHTQRTPTTLGPPITNNTRQPHTTTGRKFRTFQNSIKIRVGSLWQNFKNSKFQKPWWNFRAVHEYHHHHNTMAQYGGLLLPTRLPHHAQYKPPVDWSASHTSRFVCFFVCFTIVYNFTIWPVFVNNS